jgi:YVTN family beta-propeller protein
MPRRIVLGLVIAGVTAVLAATSAVPPGAANPQGLPGVSGTLWVTNTATNEVAAYDASTGNLIATIPVGPMPAEIAAPPGTGKVYVASVGNDTVSVISKSSLTVVALTAMGSKPHAVTQSPDGKFVYVAEWGTINKVGIIDTSTDRRIGEFRTGPPEAEAHVPFVTQDGKTLLVTNRRVNQVAALDTLTGAIKWTLAVGRLPCHLLAHPNGKIAYVSIAGENKLQLIDLEKPAIVGEIPLGRSPRTLQLMPTGNTLVVPVRAATAQVAVVDLRNNAVTLVSLDGTIAAHNATSEGGRYSFVNFEGASPGVAVIDMSSLTVAATYRYPGGGKPYAILYDPLRIRR